MFYLFYLISDFLRFQILFLYKITGIAKLSHYGVYPKAEVFLLEIFKLGLLGLELVLLYMAVDKSIKWYREKNIAYQDYLMSKTSSNQNVEKIREVA
jgi:hypothetical protein